MRQQTSKRGLALVLVMMVVLALAIIATPFVLSMLLQERTGTVSRYASQADYGTEGVRNYAIFRLMYGVDHMERRFGGGQGSWMFDTVDEIEVRLDENSVMNSTEVLDPKGAIWGIDVQDEQGKIDVRTAPRELIDRVQDMVDGRIVDKKDYLTMYAGRDVTWTYPQRIRSLNGQGNAVLSPAGPTGVGTENPWFFADGARVRVSKAGAPPFYAEVTANGRATQSPPNEKNWFQTDPAIPGTYIDGVVEVEQRHPVNINTAKAETLTMLFAGLRLYNKPDSVVDGAAAAGIARLFAGRRTATMEDFITKLQSASLTGNQRRAVLINAFAPTFWELLDSGTMPICFTTYDSYTIEAFASQNNPAGATVASRGFREVVTVSPPALQTRYCESQYDFDRMLSARATLQNTQYANYPLGSKMVSFPNLIPLPPFPVTFTQAPAFSDMRLKPQQSPGQPGGEAFVQIRPGVDYRGWSNIQRNLDNWQNFRPREHFNDTQDGKRTNGQAHVYDWNRVFAIDQTETQNQNNDPPTLPSVAAGGVELWARFDGVGNPDQIFDIREQDFTNRLGLRVENGELIFHASDGTIGVQGNMIDDGAAIVRMPFTPNQNDWYHFGAYYKGTDLGELALLVDGFAHPQQTFEYQNPEGQRLDTKLTGALSQTATSIALQDDSWIPTGQIVALRVGAEVMLYDKGAGTLVRGARRTQAAQHPAGAVVRPFGYSSQLRDATVTWQGPVVNCRYDRLTTGGGKLLYTFGNGRFMDVEARLDGTQQDPMTMQWFISPTDTTIPVIETPSAIMEFPDQGYIRINDEVIFYTGRKTGASMSSPLGTAEFTGCVRAQHNTTAVQHNQNSRVLQWSIAVDDYTNYLDPTILLVGDEFIGPVQKDDRPGFWVPPIKYRNSGMGLLNLRRGTLGTLRGQQMAGETVSPTFVATDSYSSGTHNMGGGDWITLTDGSNLKEQAQVRNSGPPYPNYNWPSSLQVTSMVAPGPGAGQAQLVGLYAPTSREYAPDTLPHVRALKFPSGETLGLNFVQTVNPQFSIGPFNATIDEIKFFADLYARAMPTTELSVSDQNVTLSGTGRYPNFGGLIKIGQEYMGYMAVNGQDLTNLKRGWLGPPAEIHDAGDPVFNLYWVPVTSLASDLTATDVQIELNEPLRGRTDQYRRGYVLIDDEVLLFEDNAHDDQGPANQPGGPGTILKMPARWDGRTGLYRGMFGTQPASHSANDALVYGIPWRYWDTYKQGEFDNTMSYMQWSTRLPEAHWHQIRITSEIPQGDSNIVLHALVRVDGKGDWWDPPGFTDKSLILEFVNGSGGKINRTGYLNDAGQLDVRFYTEYKQGSFDAQQPWNAHSWKRTPKIKEIQVDFDRATRTLYHEDK